MRGSDAVYFQIGTLVMAGFLKPADPLPADPHLLSWGHLMPRVEKRKNRLWVNAVAFFRDGKRLVSGSSDGMVNVWSAETGAILQSLKATNAEVRTIAVSGDGKLIAAGNRYGTLRVWETDGWRVKHDFQGHPGDLWSVAFSPNSRTLATGDSLMLLLQVELDYGQSSPS